MSPGWSFARRAAHAVALSLLLPGCGGWLDVNRVSSAQKKPNNAWVFFSVERGGQPVTDLTADDLAIYEDSARVDKDTTKQILQSADAAAVRSTLLLVDVSGTGTSGAPDEVVSAAKAFADRVGKAQKVGVYAFDGEAKLHPIIPFSDAPAKASPSDKAFDALRRFRAKDSSTNLHGAVVEGLRELRRTLEREHKPIRFGTLVVLAQGIDRANRVSRDAMRDEMDSGKYKLYEVVAVGAAGPNDDRSYLDEVARDGMEVALDRSGLKDALDKVATRIESHAKRYYLLSFCTTARSGEREVRVEARLRNPNASGSFSYTFNADGLGPPPECDPKTPPPPELKPPEEKERERDDARPAGKGSPKGTPQQPLIDTPPPESSPHR